MEYTYDEMNRLTQIIDPEGNVIKKYIYDEDGRIVKEIDAKGYSSADNDEERWGQYINTTFPDGLLRRGHRTAEKW